MTLELLIADDGERQDEVWERVSRYDTAFGASPTASYVDHLNRRADPILDGGGEVQGSALESVDTAGIPRIRALVGQRGVLIGLGGQPAFLEIFASPSGLRRHLPGLLEAAAIDASMLPAEQTPGSRARRFAAQLVNATMGPDVGADAGAGEALASRSPGYDIRGLGWDDQLLYATVFNRRHHLMELA
jgi:hypothetical protein